MRHKKSYYLKYQILKGYLVMIGFTLLFVFFLVRFFWNHYVQESIYQSMSNENYQIESVIDLSLDDLVRLSEYPFIDEELLDVLRRDYSVLSGGESKTVRIADAQLVNRKLYQNVFYLNRYIDSVWLFWDYPGRYAVKSTELLNSGYDVKEESWYQKVRDGEGRAYVIGVHADRGSFYGKDVISVARSVPDPVDGKHLGMLIINVKVEDFVRLWYPVEKNDTVIAVADQKNRLIFSDTKGMDTEGFAAYLDGEGDRLAEGRPYEVRVDGTAYYLIATELECIQGRIYHFNPVKAANAGLQIVLWGILAGAALAVILLLVIGTVISNAITRPVTKLVNSMADVEQGNLSITAEEFGGELGVLSTAFNRMMRKMDDMFRRLKQEEQEKREMEMLALQSQINPHFMYNTLSSIRWMAEIQGADNITRMVDALIRVLQYSAAQTEELVPVEKELDFIRHYIKILNFRYFERFSFLYHIDSRALTCLMPRFVLQPVIENAVMHGFDTDDIYATIEITIALEEEHLQIEITDNGKGIPPEKCEEILNKENPEKKALNQIGIYNVNRRLKLLFGQEYALRIVSREGCYTKVIARIPAIPAEACSGTEEGAGRAEGISAAAGAAGKSRGAEPAGDQGGGRKRTEETEGGDGRKGTEETEDGDGGSRQERKAGKESGSQDEKEGTDRR